MDDSPKRQVFRRLVERGSMHPIHIRSLSWNHHAPARSQSQDSVVKDRCVKDGR